MKCLHVHPRKNEVGGRVSIICMVFYKITSIRRLLSHLEHNIIELI